MSENRYTIVTTGSLTAPKQFSWYAAWNDFDLDVTTGEGATEQEAILDLVNMGLPGIK